MASPMPLDPSQVDVIAQALMQRLVPEIHKIVESVAASVATRTVQALQASQGAQQGSTELGPVQSGCTVTVDWSFANSGEGAWPSGARLRFLGGRLAPPPTFAPTVSDSPTGVGGTLAVQAAMVAPREPGPCDSHWQLQTAEGVPLSPQLLVRAVAIRADGTSSAPAAPRVQAVPASTAQPQGQPGQPLLHARAAAPAVSVQGVAGGRDALLHTGHGAVPGPASLAPAASQMPNMTPAGVRQMTSTPPGAGDHWRRAFEDFFGLEAAVRLREAPDGKERDRMLNQVWEYTKHKGLQQGDNVVLDELLSRLYGPALAVGTLRLALRDLLPLTQRIVALYLGRALPQTGSI